MTEKWGIYEIELGGPSEGNPFTDIQVSGRFRLGDKRVDAGGFYDGNGVYRIRFMPDETGEWCYETFSNCDALNGSEHALAWIGRHRRNLRYPCFPA